MDQPTPRSRTRETVLTIALVVLIGGGTFVFLDVVSLGLFSYVLAAVVVVALVGFLHYVVWGYSMSQQVAGEREEMLHREQMEQAETDRRHRESIRDMSRRRPTSE